MKQRVLHQLDFYKTGHHLQYPEGTQYVYSNLTARSAKHSNIPLSDGVVWVGLQLFIKDFLIDRWNETFFNRPLSEVIDKYERRVSVALNQKVSVSHLEKLHRLGYLPILVKSLPEGSVVPYKVPLLTIVNTLPEFYWLPNFLESVMSAELWQMINSATTYREYRRVFEEYAEKTGSNKDFIPFQAHDFSFRGMAGREAAAKSGFAAICAGSKGTDTVAAIDIAEDYYGARGFIAGSVNATEHSVMCAGGQDKEIDTFKRLLTEVYPTGILSIVSDSWDFWKVIYEYLPKLKDIIEKRGELNCSLSIKEELTEENENSLFKEAVENLLHGEIVSVGSRYFEMCYGPDHDSWIERYAIPSKLVIRPDSGDPFRILCGYDLMKHEIFYDGGGPFITGTDEWITPEESKGLVECLWDTFGGIVNKAGYKVLNPKIGAIYGDSITLSLQRKILERLKDKGFASENIVLGVGSYTYQYNTRDTHGIAMKATSVVINGERRDIFKDPQTDDGLKKSAKGLLMVSKAGDTYTLKDQCTFKEHTKGCLEPVFSDGKLLNETTLDEIIERNK